MERKMCLQIYLAQSLYSLSYLVHLHDNVYLFKSKSNNQLFD